MKARFGIAIVSGLLLLPGCSSHKDEQKRVLTERERDSTMAASKLPGAAVVGKALEEADSAKARADQPLPP
jgi:protein involved in sex pheromone biosynthesis